MTIHGSIKKQERNKYSINKDNAVKIVEKLKKMYPDAKCSLDFGTPFEMLVAVCLSAQCTDDRVNMVTPNLFKVYDTPKI